ncbi:MAG: hypothetical protein OXN84_12725 [Albidovulum sp.]|nr:hypothetical protein [Albidovulum sp.]
MIRDRQTAVNTIMERTTMELEGFPVAINSTRIERLPLPHSYPQAVKEKEKRRLDQQGLIAQRTLFRFCPDFGGAT